MHTTNTKNDLATLPLDELGLCSVMQRDLMAGNEWLHGHLQSRERFDTVDTRDRRSTALESIRTSMTSLRLDPSQVEAMARFESGCYCIVSGQQVGFLGGPLYTFYKIATALSRARQLKTEGIDSCVVFWIEDNDHDKDEAAQAWLYTKEQGMPMYSASALETIDRLAVADLHFSSDIDMELTTIQTALSPSEWTEELMSSLRSIYGSVGSWSTAFVQLLQEHFGSHGVLFLSASQARIDALMKNVLAQEAAHGGRLRTLTGLSAEELLSHGYHAQAEGSYLNLFYHNADGQRIKIQGDDSSDSYCIVGANRMTLKQLEDLVLREPASFSPSVLLRPLVQDYILGTDEFIAGPSELAYMALLPEVYKSLRLNYPRLTLRSGATYLSRRMVKQIEKVDKPLSFYFKNWSQLETIVTDSLVDQELLARIEGLGQGFNEQLEAVREHVLLVDKSLDGSCGSLRKSVEKELETLQKKVRAALKRKNEEHLGRVREIHSFVFQDAQLQERKLSPIYVYNEGGAAELQRVIQALVTAPASKHYLIYPRLA